VELQINSQTVTIDAAADLPLLWVLRDLLGMTGTKFGCGMALCGACTVLIDGQAVRSCVLPVAQAAGKAITTIEGVGTTAVGAALQGAWLDMNVPQCGYCQAGQIMSAAALLQATPAPSDADIDAAMSGNICRCGTYTRIRAAIKQAAHHAGDTK
jgi:isoquinoline 1-oxidoreductase alpha subunit